MACTNLACKADQQPRLAHALAKQQTPRMRLVTELTGTDQRLLARAVDGFVPERVYDGHTRHLFVAKTHAQGALKAEAGVVSAPQGFTWSV